ncbi:MAG: pyridoxamine 5'-phosphate oxidase family protein [Gammaproteobacteria bacterium]|nr:pyridoxamine 5'-phosphate oxidase family protein [Gammaproteobacteria bacterium]
MTAGFSAPGGKASDSPFHAAEQKVQSRLGVREAIEPWARQVVRGYLPEEHRAFYRDLPFIVAAARDDLGRAWATLLVGEPGFVTSAEPESLTIAAELLSGDPLEGALVEGADLGLLGIELHSRRRNRVNGRVGRRGLEQIHVEVDQSFGNCPQYISVRDWRRVTPGTDRTVYRGATLTDAMRASIGRADTLFIASGYRDGDSPSFGMDASHRGGDPGFVTVEDAGQLVFPDFAGNNHFNTIGNLVADARAGLLFIDFERGDLLQLTGRAEIEWEADAARFPGAQRLVRFHIEHVVARAGVLPMRWTRNAPIQRLEVIEKIRESEDVTSFVIEAADERPIAPFDAGQYLPISIELPGSNATYTRTYSLSNSPNESRYRISVKREAHGAVSGFLHDHVQPGTVLFAGAPAGDFVVNDSPRAVVLLSAGVGITPMVSLLHSLVSGAQPRPVWFVHGARDRDHLPLYEEVRAVARDAGGVARLHLSLSAAGPNDELGVDYDALGRVSVDVLETLVPGLDADFYVCGPVSFASDMLRQLSAAGVADRLVHVESFGATGH